MHPECICGRGPLPNPTEKAYSAPPTPLASEEGASHLRFGLEFRPCLKSIQIPGSAAVHVRCRLDRLETIVYNTRSIAYEVMFLDSVRCWVLCALHV